LNYKRISPKEQFGGKQMSNVLLPKYVFVSYSHQDKGFAQKIINDLRKANFDVWIDYVGLQPGTPNWNKAIRDAISHSFAVLLLASPNSEQSDVVQGELSLARRKRCPIYPIWIGGAWEESVPLNMIQAQRIDCREAHYDSCLPKIIDTLKNTFDARAPKHCLVDSSDEWSFPSRHYLYIHLNRIKTKTDKLNIVAIRPSLYQSLESLLDDLYTCYLSKQYKPYTYGEDWVITSRATSVQRLLVPWSWFIEKGNHQALNWSNPSWQQSSLDTYGLVAGTRWGIIDTFPIPTFGVASKDPYIGKYLLHRAAYEEETGGKAATYFDEIISYEASKNNEDIMEIISPTALNQNDYEFLFVFATDINKLAGKVFIPKHGSFISRKAHSSI